jgi:2-dehydropantoate 2-reductase
MRVVVVGAGAIGTFYAAKLAAETSISLIVRREEDAAAIRSGGVRITGLEQLTIPVNASTQLRAIEPDTLVLLTTKAYDNRAAAEGIAPLVRRDTLLVCLQNGLHSERVVKGVVGDRCTVLRGITDFGVIFATAGEVVLKARGPTLIESSPRSQEVADLFTRAQLDGRACADIRREVWRKLIVNCVINPVTAMTGMEVGWIADVRLNPLKQQIIDECLKVARCDGVVFEDDMLRMLNERYAPSRNLSSMLQDLSRGKRTEIDYMNGAVADLGRKYGVPCPINEALVAIVKALEGNRH